MSNLVAFFVVPSKY
uniref:Uncharacterized protein n=1 Tax=Arundo donax TaxID=35708 RepID=A0A0A9B1X6_ARUDO